MSNYDPSNEELGFKLEQAEQILFLQSSVTSDCRQELSNADSKKTQNLRNVIGYSKVRIKQRTMNEPARNQNGQENKKR